MLNADLLGIKYYLYFDTLDVSGEVFLPIAESKLGDEDRKIRCDWLYCLVDELDWKTESPMEIIEHGEIAENPSPYTPRIAITRNDVIFPLQSKAD